MNHIHINDNTKVKKLMVIGQCGISYLLVQHQKISEISADIQNNNNKKRNIQTEHIYNVIRKSN